MTIIEKFNKQILFCWLKTLWRSLERFGGLWGGLWEGECFLRGVRVGVGDLEAWTHATAWVKLGEMVCDALSKGFTLPNWYRSSQIFQRILFQLLSDIVALADHVVHSNSIIHIATSHTNRITKTHICKCLPANVVCKWYVDLALLIGSRGGLSSLHTGTAHFLEIGLHIYGWQRRNLATEELGETIFEL